MRKLIPFMVVAGLAVGGFFLWRNMTAWSSPPVRQFSLSYEATFTDFPAEAQKLRLWIPLGSSGDGQTILERTIIALGKYEITKDPVHGNEMIYAEIQAPFPEKLDFKIDYRATTDKAVYRDHIKKEGGENLGVYLRPTRLMIVDEEVKARAEAATEGKTKTLAKTRGIYDHVMSRMEYNKEVPGWGRGDTKRACDLGKGNCTDFHSLFISMSQAKRIPARFKIGFTVPQGEAQSLKGYHCWAEFYEEKRGWLPVDASDAWKHPERKNAYFAQFDTNKFLISTGRDIDLVPLQSGDPVNIFFYPYAEVDGKEFGGIQTQFQYQP